MDLVDLSPIRFAPLVAPVIDRVVIGIHLRAQPRARELARSHDLERAGALVEFRAALLAGPIERRTMEAVSRYMPGGALDEELAYQTDRGTLAIVDDGRAVVVTDRGRSIVNQIYDLHGEVASEAWGARGADLPRLAELTQRLLDAARPTGGPAFGGMSRPYERPGDQTAVVLFNRLAALRYHRADAHAAAWAAAGHTAESIAVAPKADREAIEADTNRRAAPPYAALSADERLAFLAGLAALPS